MIAKRDPDATRAAILEAAEEVFLERGFGNAALSEIARRAGVTKSLIHHHFRSKDELWREVKMGRFIPYAEQQQAMLEAAEPSVDLLRESIKVYFRFLGANPALVRIMAWMFLERDADECVTKDRELLELGVQRLRQAQEAGDVRADLDPRFILFTFLGLAQHWFQDRNHFIHDFGLDGLDDEHLDEAYLADMSSIFFDGILPRPEKP
jgi:TetR/AcrR family transcriptional regulator